jgi:hypothetical protein
MVEDGEDELQNALNNVAITLERDGMMKRGLKERILDTVSTLRKLFVKLKTNCDTKLLRQVN